MKTSRYCDQIILVALITLVITLPLFFDIRVYSVFDLTKVVAMLLPALLIMAVWLIKIIFNEKFEFPNTALNLPILAFITLTIIATTFSIHPYTSLMGAYKRFEGLIETCTYIFLFFAFVTFINSVRKLNLVINAIVVTAASTSIYGFIQFFGKDPFAWSSSTPERIFSTFGNPVFYSAFLITTLPLSLALYLGYQRKEGRGQFAVCSSQLANCNLIKDIIYGICTLLIYTIFWHTKTRADFLGLLVLLPIFIVFLGRERIRLNKWKLLIMFILFVIIGTFYGIRPQSSVFTYFVNEISLNENKEDKEVEDSVAGSSSENDRSFLVSKLSGSSLNRYYQFKTGLKIFNEYPVLGLGPDTLGLVYQKYLAEVFSRRKDDNFYWPRHDKIHNDVLDNAVSKGALGLTTYIWLVLAYFCLVWKFLKTESLDQTIQSSIVNRQSSIDKRLLVVSFGSAILGYLVQNEFSFGNTVIVAIFWIVLALTVVVIRKDSFQFSPDNRGLREVLTGVNGDLQSPIANPQSSTRKVLLSILVVSLITFLVINVLRWYKADMYMEKGRKDMRMGNLEDGLEAYEYAISYNPYEVSYRDMLNNALFTVANATKEKIWPENIISVSKETLEMMPNHYPGLYALGNAYYLLSKNYGAQTIDLAIEYYKKTIEVDPFQPQLYHYLAISYYKKGMIDDAVENMKKAIITATNDMEYIDQLSRMYLQENMLDELKRLIDETPPTLTPTASFCNTKGFFLVKNGKNEDAYIEFTKALEISPDDMEALDNVINLGLQMKKTGSTIDHLKHAIELKPDNVDYRIKLGNFYAQEGYLDESIKQFNQIMQIDPDKKVLCLDKLGKIYMARKEFGNSILCFKKAIEINPSNAELYNNLGTVYVQNNMHDNAILEIKKALEIVSDDITFLENLSKIYYIQKKYEDAEDILNRIVKLDEDNKEAVELIRQIKQRKIP